MLSPESAEEKEGDWRLRAEREMLTLSDAEIDHDLGAVGGGGGTESVDGGVFPDPKRRRLAEKLAIAVEDDEVMEEDEKQKMEEIRKEKLKVMPPLDMAELLKIAYSSERVPLNLCSRDIDAIMDICDEDSSDDVVEKEEEVDEKVKEILDNVEKASVSPFANFYLLRPSSGDDECTYVQINSRRLDIFYKRLVPKVKNSWRFYVKEISHANRRADFLKALDIAKTLNLDKLDNENIHECFVDVFVERDTIAMYKLKTEYDLFLLECRYNQNLHPKNFAPKYRPPIMDSPYFVPSAQQQMFDRWMEKNCSELQKEECEFAIRARYEKEQKKDCSTRIRYIRYKRGLAKELGLIPYLEHDGTLKK